MTDDKIIMERAIGEAIYATMAELLQIQAERDAQFVAQTEIETVDGHTWAIAIRHVGHKPIKGLGSDQ